VFFYLLQKDSFKKPMHMTKRGKHPPPAGGPLFEKEGMVLMILLALQGFSPSFGKEGGTRSVTGVFPMPIHPHLL